jgi:hypothetical protein
VSIGHAVLTGRADQHSKELAMTPTANDKEIRTSRLLDEHWCWMALDNF